MKTRPSLKAITKKLREQEQTVNSFKLEDYLFDKQLAFVHDPSPFKIAVTSRRAGKTVSCGADLVHEALNTSDVICLYITLSRNNAKKLIWPELKKINRSFKLKAIVNESDLSLTFPNGSIIYCSGASDRSEIEKFRGLALKKVYIDEGQSFPSYIQDLIDEVLAPALMDYAGILCLIGTPPPIPTGYFFDASKSSAWSKHSWTFFDNPFISSKAGIPHQAILDRELARRGVSISDPSIQREWFGKWALDTDSLVYKFNDKLNVYKDLPKHKFTYILGIDIGFNDADALAVIGWCGEDPTTYLIEEKIVKQQGITELVEQIEDIRKRYDISKIVMDTGGLGKKIAEEIIRRYRIPVLAAEKVRKVENIELMNDALRTGKLKARGNSRFAEDCLKVEWDLDKSTPDKKVISKRFHSDICEAVLYAWREAMSFVYEKPKEIAKMGSPEWLEELEEKALEHFTKLANDENDDPFR